MTMHNELFLQLPLFCLNLSACFSTPPCYLLINQHSYSHPGWGLCISHAHYDATQLSICYQQLSASVVCFLHHAASHLATKTLFLHSSVTCYLWMGLEVLQQYLHAPALLALPCGLLEQISNENCIVSKIINQQSLQTQQLLTLTGTFCADQGQ